MTDCIGCVWCFWWSLTFWKLTKFSHFSCLGKLWSNGVCLMDWGFLDFDYFLCFIWFVAFPIYFVFTISINNFLVLPYVDWLLACWYFYILFYLLSYRTYSKRRTRVRETERNIRKIEIKRVTAGIEWERHKEESNSEKEKQKEREMRGRQK